MTDHTGSLIDRIEALRTDYPFDLSYNSALNHFISVIRQHEAESKRNHLHCEVPKVHAREIRDGSPLDELDRFLEAMRDGAYAVSDNVMNEASIHLHSLRSYLTQVSIMEDTLDAMRPYLRTTEPVSSDLSMGEAGPQLADARPDASEVRKSAVRAMEDTSPVTQQPITVIPHEAKQGARCPSAWTTGQPDESCNGKRLLEWLDNPNRLPAFRSFTDGYERQIAYRFEMSTKRELHQPDDSPNFLKTLIANDVLIRNLIHGTEFENDPAVQLVLAENTRCIQNPPKRESVDLDKCADAVRQVFDLSLTGPDSGFKPEDVAEAVLKAAGIQWRRGSDDT